MKKKLVILLLILFTISLGAYYLVLSSKPVELKKIEVSLTWLHQAQFAGMYVAKDKGFYQDEGLDVSFKEFAVGKNLEQELVEEKVDFAIWHSDQFLDNFSRGMDIKAIGAIYQKIPHALLTSSEKSIKKPTDFEGKILGMKGNTKSGVFLYATLLSELGVDESKVSYKSVDFNTSEFEDITNNTVDMIDLYRTDQVYVFEQNNVEYDLFLPEDFGFETYGDVIVTSNTLLKNNPEIAEKFVKATLKGWEYTSQNPEEALDITQKYIVSEIYQDRDYNQFILSKSLPLIKPKRNQKIGEMNFVKWKNLYDVMYDNGFLEKEFDVTDTYTTEFVDK